MRALHESRHGGCLRMVLLGLGSTLTYPCPLPKRVPNFQAVRQRPIPQARYHPSILTPSSSVMASATHLMHSVPDGLNCCNAHTVALVGGERQQRCYQVLAGGSQPQPQAPCRTS
jgi:hypothetical protein